MRVCPTLLLPLLATLCALPSCAFTDEEGTLDVQAPPPSLAAPPAEGEPLGEDLLAEVEGVILGDVGKDRTVALGDALGAADASLTVEQAISRSCTTTIVRGLSTQLVEEINCLRPDTLRPIPQRDDVALDPSVFPYLQSPALAALARALDAKSGVMYINSGLRTIAQQYLLYRWYQAGRRCGIRLAAAPGKSNHESGLALDLDNYSTWRTTMTRHGWRWFGSSDAVHFDFVGSGAVSLSGLSVRAFQRLWNHNNPNDRISEDGIWGNQTAQRLARSPAAGFSKGATCAQIAQPQADQFAPVEVYWAREANGVYVLRALAPSAVVRVDYLVDDFKIASSTRDDGANFPASYTFNVERNERLFEVRGFDAQGRQIALGQGLIDVTPGTAVAIRQIGAGLYEIGLERPPIGAAALEVRADGVLLTDGLTQTTRSERLGVRSSFHQLGPRNFELTTYNADGTPRGTLRRTFTLR
jgi:hypothetical protein